MFSVIVDASVGWTISSYALYVNIWQQAKLREYWWVFRVGHLDFYGSSHRLSISWCVQTRLNSASTYLNLSRIIQRCCTILSVVDWLKYGPDKMIT